MALLEFVAGNLDKRNVCTSTSVVKIGMVILEEAIAGFHQMILISCMTLILHQKCSATIRSGFSDN